MEYIILAIIIFIYSADVFYKHHTTKGRRRYGNDNPYRSTIRDGEYYKETKDLIDFREMKTEYMESQAWQDKRQRVLKRDSHECQLCYSTDNLEVHHTKYDRVPYEPIDHLILLCRSCHQKEHDKHGYPSTYQEYMKWNHPIY
jgi:hypothetical protein